MDVSNKTAGHLSDDYDRRLFESFMNPVFASHILRIKKNDPEAKGFTIEVQGNNYNYSSEDAWVRVGQILGQASQLHALKLIHIPKDVCVGLQHNKSIKSLYLRLPFIPGAVFGSMSSFVPLLIQSPSLENLSLRNCRLGSTELSLLSDALLRRPVNNLKCLSLGNNRFGDINLDKLVLALSKNFHLAELNLSYTGIGTKGCTSLTKLLEAQSNLRHLHLRGNSIKDKPTVLLAESLTNNTNLLYLDIGRNWIAAAGWMALLKLVCNCSSMDSIKDSNHTLSLFYVRMDPGEVRAIAVLSVSDANLLRAALEVNLNDDKNIVVRNKLLWSHARGDINIGSSSIDNGTIPCILGWIADNSNETIRYYGPHLPNAEIAIVRLDSMYRLIRSRPYLCTRVKNED